MLAVNVLEHIVHEA